MAEWSAKWTTSGAGSGDQVAGYTQAYYKIIYEILSACLGFEGVAPGFLNELEGTVTGANTVQIDTGGALVDGHIYQNGAAEDVNIPNAIGAGNTRIDRIVLRCDWTAFTVRLYRIAGTDAGTPTAPAITQTSGTTYDILLYQALVTTAGAVTLTDERTLAEVSDGSITPAKTTFLDDMSSAAAIYAGHVASDGSAVRLPSGWTSSKTNTGTYSIIHNLGTTSYVVVAVPSPSSNTVPTISAGPVSANSFTVYALDADVDAALKDLAFMFIVIAY